MCDISKVLCIFAQILEEIDNVFEEIDEKIKEMATSYGRKEEELSKNEALVEYLRNSVKTEKAIELIVKNAKIKK